MVAHTLTLKAAITKLMDGATERILALNIHLDAMPTKKATKRSSGGAQVKKYSANDKKKKK